MKDFLGSELNIGDEVVAISSIGQRTLHRGKIRGFSPKMVDVEGTKCKYPEALVKIPKDYSAYIEGLEKDSRHLNILQNLGVDNWEGYGMVGDDHCTECMYPKDQCACGEEEQD